MAVFVPILKKITERGRLDGLAARRLCCIRFIFNLFAFLETKSFG